MAAVKQRAGNHAKSVGDEISKQVGATATLAKDASTSTAWLYPIRGVFYLAGHRELYKPILSALMGAALVSVITVLACFVLLYLPQAGFLALFSGPLGFIAAVPLVLSEAAVISLTLGKLLYLDGAAEDLFDATLMVKGHESLVGNGRSLGKKGGSVAKRMGTRLSKPLSRFSAASIARYIISLPLNFVPGLGTALFLLFNGSRAGPSYHNRYFELKKLSSDKREAFVKKNSGSYTAFGVAAQALQLVPVAGLALTLSTSVGAALWAADIESSDALSKMSDAPQPSGKSRSEL